VIALGDLICGTVRFLLSIKLLLVGYSPSNLISATK